MTDQTTSADLDPAPARAPMRIRARGRSFLALVLSPEAPLDAWLEGLDNQIARSVGFFAGRPVILDLGLVTQDAEGLEGLQTALKERSIHMIGIEGADRSWPALAAWDWPASLEGGRASGAVEFPEAEGEAQAPVEAAPQRAESLIIDRAIRSGQSIMHLDGDVVVIGSVASGAELVAGGSIHVYGALRGRAIAGVGGQPNARIFAARMQAELLAIDGFYMIAEEMDAEIHDQPAQALLSEDRVTVTKLP
ncbi:septum site-determining protein MinC [Asaia spathodeae]|uniref:Probable septum site-determining protein MinC n=1 Tax=Asaia spathodeae TaxID=657016 RepID=A0ABX2P5J3_9PROT|nr:septum site-determining protein MinC [Asaia spathodeae]GBR21817.1 septum formation inhibitor [Asaia spathodeae NBRC 105894]